MIRLSICITICTSLILLRCEPNTNPSSAVPGAEAFVAFTLDGTTKRITQYVTGVVDTSKGTVRTIISGISMPGSANSESIIITANGRAIGVRSGDTNDLLMYQHGQVVDSVFLSAITKSKPSIVLTRLDSVGGWIEGTFEGKIGNGRTDKTITLGSFKVIRVSLDTSGSGPTPTINNYLRVSFKGTNYKFEPLAIGQQVCTLTTVTGQNGLDTSGLLFVNSAVSGTFSNKNTGFLLKVKTPTVQNFDPSEIYSYSSGTITYDVFDSANTNPMTNQVDTFVHVDSVVCHLSVSLVVGSFRVSGTFSGELGTADPSNNATKYRLKPPLHYGVTGTFSAPVPMIIGCDRTIKYAPTGH